MEARRFVVLRHEPGITGSPDLHWDLMLEFGDSLRTWALSSEPQVGHAIPGEELQPHRAEYLDYEGPISGGRGSVSRFDRGSFEVLHESARHLTIALHGELLEARLELTRGATDQRWTARFIST